MRYLLVLIMMFLSATVFGQQVVKPEGRLLAVYLFSLLVAVFLLIYFAFIKREKTTRPVKLGIQLKVFYDNYPGRGSKYLFRKLEVKIMNRGKNPVEFGSPFIQFEKFNKKRKFKPKMQEEQRLYPLSLFPGTDHTFKIDLGKFYQNDSSLQTYRTLKLLIPDTNGEIIKQQKIKF